MTPTSSGGGWAFHHALAQVRAPGYTIHPTNGAAQAARADDRADPTGYGLPVGIHGRIEGTIDAATRRIRVGNIYVNRNMVGAVVGVQPFGGEGLSGTGPKAGGPHYLYRFATERTLTIDTTAAGGNASLMSMDEEMPV